MKKLPKVLVASSNMGGKESNFMVTQNNVEATFICYNDLNFPLRDKSMKSRLTSKIPRCMSWDMHPGYDYYVWVDFTFNITNPNTIYWLISQMGDNKIALFRHYMRTSIKEEYEFIKYNIENPHAEGYEYLVERYLNENMKTQVKLYLSDKTFIDNNLFELGCFIYHKSIIENKEHNIMKEFFHHICYYSVMDQLSFPYLLHKFKIKPSIINQNIRKCPYLNHHTDKIKESKFSIVIPTLWKANEQFIPMLTNYINNELVGEIIIIDNNISQTPPLPNHPKLKVLKQKENIYVNPAWNLGVKEAEFDKLIIANDDIFINESDLQDLLNKAFKTLDDNDKILIGINYLCYSNPPSNIKISKFEFPQFHRHEFTFGYGCLMFLNTKDYIEIPKELKIWCGDNYLFHNLEPWEVTGLKMREVVSSTIDLNRSLYDPIMDEDTKYYREKILKPILCFYIEPGLEINTQLKNTFIKKSTDHDVYVFGDFTHPFEEENIKYINYKELKRFRSFNVFEKVIKMF